MEHVYILILIEQVTCESQTKQHRSHHVPPACPPTPNPCLYSTVWRQDGVRGLYRGCAVNLLRTTPAAALTFTSFELIARSLRRLGQQGEAAAA